MTLDNEQDRKVLLDIIAASSIQGTAVMVVAELIKKIVSAEVVAKEG